jgi:hypothetical protein
MTLIYLHRLITNFLHLDLVSMMRTSCTHQEEIKRNDRIFSNKVLNQEEIFDRIRVSSWKWLLAKKISMPCLFYEWCIDPFDCIAR